MNKMLLMMKFNQIPSDLRSNKHIVHVATQVTPTNALFCNLCAVFHIAPTHLGIIISPSSGSCLALNKLKSHPD
jgi:hypothetical protein